MFNKPRGCITAKRDVRHKTVMEYFPSELSSVLFPVGRLDKDTEGLLIMTSDGDLCQKLTSPLSMIPKNYFFLALGEMDEKKISEIERGASVFSDGETLCAPSSVKIIEKTTLSEVSSFLSEEYVKLSKKKPDSLVTVGEITVTEGKKHQVKRMVGYTGAVVIYLKRVAIGGLMLDESLPLGSYRGLSDRDIELIQTRLP